MQLTFLLMETSRFYSERMDKLEKYYDKVVFSDVYLSRENKW
jgi:formate-dependent nitrite reductase cytochrome c552 subunit